MGTGIGWIIMGCIYYFLFKKKNDYIYKANSEAFIIIGVIAIIVGIINLFLKSDILENGVIALLIPAIILVIIKMKRYNTALKIADKLTEK